MPAARAMLAAVADVITSDDHRLDHRPRSRSEGPTDPGPQRIGEGEDSDWRPSVRLRRAGEQQQPGAAARFAIDDGLPFIGSRVPGQRERKDRFRGAHHQALVIATARMARPGHRIRVSIGWSYRRSEVVVLWQGDPAELVGRGQQRPRERTRRCAGRDEPGVVLGTQRQRESCPDSPLGRPVPADTARRAAPVDSRSACPSCR